MHALIYKQHPCNARLKKTDQRSSLLSYEQPCGGRIRSVMFQKAQRLATTGR